MSDERPWWLSDPGPAPGWTGLVTQAQRVLSWVSTYANEQILAPHATHDTPGEHPDCALCQATGLLATPAPTAREEIAWVDARWTT